jgi:sphinganine-1-phosphate aldolase
MTILIISISEIPNLHVLGDPPLSVVAFYATSIKTYAVADLLTQRGWHLNILQFPPSIHVACTLLTVPVVQYLLSDLKDVVEILVENPDAGNGDISAIYGTAASVPDRSIIADVSKGFLDGLTLLENK